MTAAWWPARETRHIGLALLLLLGALAVPSVELPGRAADTIVVFDITQSMDVEDMELDGARVGRLAFARASMRRALAGLPCGSRVGWAAFAEYRTLLLLAPLEVCTYYNDLLATLDAIDGRMRWGNASEITKGAYWALRMARETGTHPQVVFLTDGHEAPPLGDIAIAPFDDIRPGEIHGWILGVGGDEAKPIPKTDPDGKRLGFWRAEDVAQREGGARARGSLAPEHLSALQEPHLQALARRIEFGYARLADAGTLGAALRDTGFAQRRPVPTALAWLPALIALALLVWRFGVPGSRRSPRLR